MKRDDFITNLEHDGFNHDEQRKGVARKFGKYRPVRAGKGKDINKYVCKSLEKDDDKEYMFDMGYVQRKMLLRCVPLSDSGKEKLDAKSIYE